jgi:O-antigen/teichoic acid export membrane protein
MPITLLQGTGDHRFVAVAASGCAAANLLLSIPLVKWLGLAGVALGTIIPVAVFALVIFARSCAAVRLNAWHGARQIVWPTVWPAAIVIGVLWIITEGRSPGLVTVLGHVLLGGLLYSAIFFTGGLEKDERRWLLSTLMAIRSRSNPRLPAESALR